MTDIEALRALANPRRLRIRQYLELRGPATSAVLARDLGLNTGATSYHLRELARYGFVEEVAELAHGRERWWRSAKVDLRFPPLSQQGPQVRAVFMEMSRLSFDADLEDFARFQLNQDAMGEWADTLRYSRGSIRVGADRFERFFEDYIALLNRYKEPDADPSESRTIQVRMLAFPQPDIEPPGAPRAATDFE